jgi:hypothetical protein
MEQQNTEPVELERVRKDAACIIIRVGLGSYELAGPQDNILIPESRVAWATVVHDLEGEGYVMVTPNEYAEVTCTAVEDVDIKIKQQGNLFAVSYRDEMVVPLPRKEAVLPEIKV